MCGICGKLDFSGAPVSEDLLRRMTARLAHRGPDDSGFYLSHQGGVGCGLGHRRLSIIDLSAAGRQPMANEDGSLRMVFNGEIYNFAALRGELEAKGHRFSSRTDSEVILHLFEEEGAGRHRPPQRHVRPGPLVGEDANPYPGPRPDRRQAARLRLGWAASPFRLGDPGPPRRPRRSPGDRPGGAGPLPEPQLHPRPPHDFQKHPQAPPGPPPDGPKRHPEGGEILGHRPRDVIRNDGSRGF